MDDLTGQVDHFPGDGHNHFGEEDEFVEPYDMLVPDFNKDIDIAMMMGSHPLQPMLELPRRTKIRGKNMDTIKRAFDLGKAQATAEFYKQAGILDAIGKMQAADPRKLIPVLTTAGLLGLGAAAGSHGDDILGLLGRAGGGLTAGLSAGALGAAHPGMFAVPETTLAQRMASEVSAKAANPEALGNAVAGIAAATAGAIAAPYAIYNAGKASNDSWL
jgi:hypothetical protein